MKKIPFYLFMFLTMWSCEKESKIGQEALNVSGICTGDNPKIVNVQLKSGEISSTEIDCYVFGSTLFDPVSSGFGYVDCNSDFNLVNPITGESISKFRLPGLLTQTVIDSSENALIGEYYENDSSYIVKLDLLNGNILAKNSIDFSKGIYACTYFYSSDDKEYVLLRADSTLIYINPNSGTLTKSIKVKSIIDNSVYDQQNHRLIGVNYSSITDQNYIEILDVETGESISKVDIKEKFSYYGCISGFDAESNCYILVNPDNKILFIDIESGEIKDSYWVDFEIKEFKFWRSIS